MKLELQKINKQLIMYALFGILTTLVNITAYFFFVRFISLDFFISNLLAWIISILFAYITNRIYVFKSKASGIRNLMREVFLFIATRLFSGVLDMVALYMFVETLSFKDGVSKLITNIMVIFTNYLFGRLIVFKNGRSHF